MEKRTERGERIPRSLITNKLNIPKFHQKYSSKERGEVEEEREGEKKKSQKGILLTVISAEGLRLGVLVKGNC